MLYRTGRYSVDVKDDGSILVKPGDWLSKYSAAIYNNFTTIHVFARPDARGKPGPIRNVNLIYAGERLIHVPTYGRVKPQEKPPTPPPLSDAEKKKLIEETLKKDFNLKGENLKILDNAIEIMGYAENAIALAEIAGLIAEGGAIAATGTALSIAGAFLFPVAATIALVNAYETGYRMTGMRGVAYGITAWAFDHPQPPMPDVFRDNIIFAYGKTRGTEDAKRHDKAWNEARDSAVAGLEESVTQSGKQKSSWQIAYRALGDDKPKKLAEELMKGLEKKLRPGSNRDMFWSPRPDYPKV